MFVCLPGWVVRQRLPIGELDEQLAQLLDERKDGFVWQRHCGAALQIEQIQLLREGRPSHTPLLLTLQRGEAR